MLKIGITMRITEAAGYQEMRDSLAQDWSHFMVRYMPEAMWLAVPNTGTSVIPYLEKWNINAVILSGGDDIGKYPIRDLTENTIISWAYEHNIPLLGVCRGLQLIYEWLGGKVEKMPDSEAMLHKATRHNIILDGVVREVNSYHTSMLTHFDDLKAEIAAVYNNSIEALRYANMMGIMWHPERETDLPVWQRDMINNFFSRGA